MFRRMLMAGMVVPLFVTVLSFVAIARAGAAVPTVVSLTFDDGGDTQTTAQSQFAVKREELRVAQTEAALRAQAAGARNRTFDLFLRPPRGGGLRMRLNGLAGALSPLLGARLFDLPGGGSMLHTDTRGR